MILAWRGLNVPGIERLTGAGIYYGAAQTEARSCEGEEVYIIGAANSAGQGAMYFSKYASKVIILVRGDSLTKSMSQYLIDQIEATPNIEVRINTSVVEAKGETSLSELTLVNNLTDEQETVGLEDTIKLFSFKLKHAIEIHRCYGENLPQILAYGSELNQVWTNLIDNAIDAMNEKGILEIKTSLFENSLKVEITDSGTGIPEEVQSRMFEPFFTTKGVGKGSGLGLDAVRRIVENRHKGAISLESKPGKTTFRICLPIAGCEKG